jgi:hypothetical protein
MSLINHGISAHYNGGLAQGGNGVLDWIKKGNQFAKDHRLVSRAKEISDVTGLSDHLRGSVHGKRLLGLADLAISKGYGRRKPRKSGMGKKRRTRK